MPQAGYVYLVHALGTKRYKIGRSLDVNRRVERLGQQSPFPLKLLAVLYSEDFVREERRLHRIALKHHVCGEWFELPDDWLRDIDSWFYNRDCEKYSGRSGILLLSTDKSEFIRLERAIALLGAYTTTGLSKKTKKELAEILGRLPQNVNEAAYLKSVLKKKLKSCKSGVDNLGGVLSPDF